MKVEEFDKIIWKKGIKFTHKKLEGELDVCGVDFVNRLIQVRPFHPNIRKNKIDDISCLFVDISDIIKIIIAL